MYNPNMRQVIMIPILSQPNNNYNPNSKTVLVRLTLSDHWELGRITTMPHPFWVILGLLVDIWQIFSG